MFVILVYDIGEKRVQNVHSVFEGEITEANLLRLINEIKEIIDESQDSVLIYKFRTKAYYERQEIGIPKPSHEDFIL
jgi:CRISPR-associated protein Cas2